MKSGNRRLSFVILSISLAVLLPVNAIEVGEGVLVDVTGGDKNWESGKVVAKDGRGGYTVRLLGVGEHKGEFVVPERFIFGYHKNAPSTAGSTDASLPAALQSSAVQVTSGSEASGDPVKIGEGVLVDVTGGAKNWESGKVVAKDGRGNYTVRMLGVGEHKGEYVVPLHFLFGYHKKNQNSAHASSSPAASSSSFGIGNGSSNSTGSSSAWAALSKDIDERVKKSQSIKAQTKSGAGFTSNTSDAWKSMSADIDARIAKVNGQGDKVKSTGPAKPVGGSKGLNGLYLRHEQVWMGTSLNYKEDHYLFFPDGRFYNDVPPEGLSKFNWAKAQASNPGKCGQYGINGDQIILSYPGEAPITWKLKIKSPSEMDLNYAPTVKVASFGINARLSGTYSRGSTFGAAQSYTGAPTITSSGTYTFSPDGTVSNQSTAGIDGDTKVSGVTAGVRQSGRGTYSISGNDMSMTLGGSAMSCTVYPIYDRGNSKVPVRISINGLLYERRK